MKQFLLEFENFKNRVTGLDDILDDVIQDSQLQNVLRRMAYENGYREIVDLILLMQSDTCSLRPVNMSRLQKIESVKRFVNSISKDDQVDDPNTPTMFTPPIQKGQMIYVDFAGVGAELNNKHFAIVWDDVTDKQDKIVVIPVKSEKPKYRDYPNSFSIGNVDFFPKETWVDVRELTSISRKRICATQFESMQNANDFREVYLCSEQENRIEDAFRVYWGKQKSLLDRILENNKQRIPAFGDPDVQIHHFFRPVKYFKTDPSRTKSEYTFFNDNTIYEIIWRDATTSINQGERRKLIKEIAYASANIQNDRVLSNRIQSKMRLYSAIQAI
ncbi:type II toxin-antitoxin system PemK/MazF family toxin [Paenibacillus sp. ACRSA]|uniref:type II toxin-antitoxin system PemK/MazF family toxin n=1 Tax=Paenibacillus sp. ACRSA TaxID=2918211 RepID=UPI001EF61FE8|nr:type II toxin-antitoxin system PemK/MazF family toxin [Paenibacillus sp. ACRSA]MCG7377360.1 type II toxin-antitoxin system PemK/MazF family toxin [Paenibacillus sp. ACRSA]